MTTVFIPDQHWCKQYGTLCTSANTWNECKLTACNKIRMYPYVPVVEIKREEKKMTNREWLENLSDERLTKLLMGACDNYCIGCNCEYDCVKGITTWLQQEHKEPKKELTAAQLYGVFRKGFQDRRAISLEEAEKIIKGVFEDE